MSASATIRAIQWFAASCLSLPLLVLACSPSNGDARSQGPAAAPGQRAAAAGPRARFLVGPARPAWRLPAGSRAGAAACPIEALDHSITCARDEAPVDQDIPIAYKGYDYARYMFLGGYGCERDFCLYDADKPELVFVGPALTTLIDRSLVFYRKEQGRGLRGISLIVSGDRVSDLRGTCFYSNSHARLSEDELHRRCILLAKGEGS